MRETCSVVEQPSGEVCFLFTDVQGSTRLWAEHTSAMEVALARTRSSSCAPRSRPRAGMCSLDRWGRCRSGLSNGTHAAVAAAIAAQTDAAQRALGWASRRSRGAHGSAPRNRPRTRAELLRARGEPRRRTCDVGGVGRSGALHDGGRGRVDVTTDPLGEHRLRDVPGTTTLLQVTVPGLRNDFPHVRTLDAAPSTIPAQRSTFFGRHDDIRGGASRPARPTLSSR